MGRAPRPMPLSVAYVLVILVLHLILPGLALFGSLLRGHLLLLLVNLVVVMGAVALIAALLVRQRMAWQWGRLVGALGGGLLFFVSSIGLIVSIKAGDATDTLITGIYLIDSFLTMGMCYAMRQRSALEYFDLICPACGEDSTTANDFFFTTVRCPACRLVWNDSADVPLAETPFGPDDRPARARAADPLDVLPVETAPPAPIAQRPEVPFDLSRLALPRPRRRIDLESGLAMKKLGRRMNIFFWVCIILARLIVAQVGFDPKGPGAPETVVLLTVMAPIFMIGFAGTIVYYLGWMRVRAAEARLGDARLDVLPADEPARPALPVLDVLPVTDEALTPAPRPMPAAVDWATDLRAAPILDKRPVPAPSKAKATRPLLVGLGAAVGLVLLLVCGGVLYFAMPITGSNAKPPTSAAADVSAADVSSDWVVVFRSRDPKLWNREVNRGPDDFAHRASSVPGDVEYLRLTNTATGDFVIVPITKDLLPKREEDKRYGWDGENFFEYEGHHLGIFDRTWGGGKRGEIFVCGGPHLRGWGFGHVIVEGDRQGYSWAARPIAPTVFEIAVRKGPLTKFEATKLLVGR